MSIDAKKMLIFCSW